MDYNVDYIHGIMKLPDYVCEIIETDEFSRLRNLKQLGVTNYIFQEAVHTRYHHSIGVSHLCQKMLKTLETNSGIQIDCLHKKCVIIAGLLHDLGHGPFSHLWDTIVCSFDPDWSHEEQSKSMVNSLFHNNKIRLADTDKSHNDCLDLITALITGNSYVWKKHLAPKFYFLTEIVNNKYCHIDVDKWDYLLRDAYYLENYIEIKDFSKLFEKAKVGHVIGEDGIFCSHIGYRKEDFWMIENLFENRKRLHMEIYQHTAVIGCEKMIQEVFIEAGKNGFLFKGSPLVSVHEDNDKFKYLDDSILQEIERSENENMDGAKTLIEKLKQKEFWTKIWESEEDFSKNVIHSLRLNCENHFVAATKKVDLEVPKNVPLYDDSGKVSSKTS
ncbi:unnamed protein product [Diamesa tonsa]